MGGVGSVYVRSASTHTESGTQGTDEATAVDVPSDQQCIARTQDDPWAFLHKIDTDSVENSETLNVNPSEDAGVTPDSETIAEPSPDENPSCEITEESPETAGASYSEEYDENETERLIRDPTSRADLQSFRERLSKLRTARQQAFSEKSREMRELREELARERSERQRLERLMSGEQPRERLEEVEPSRQEGSGLREEWARLPEDIDRLRERLHEDRKEAKKVQIDNKRLHIQIECLKVEIGALNSDLLRREHECAEWRRKYERLERDSSGQSDDVKRLEEKVKRLEEEKTSMWEEYDREKEEISKRTAALKEVIRVSKEMLHVRELQVTELKVKLTEIEESFAEKLRETDLKAEYEKQMQQIKELKELYEERNRILDVEHVQLNAKIASMQEEMSDLTMKYEIAAEEVDTERERVKELLADLSHLTVKARESQKELTLMNKLLTQMLVGSGPPGTRALDRITEQLQQNHDLIAQMTSCEECYDDAALLPKLLLDLCSQVEEGDNDWPQMSATCDVMTDSTDDPSTISEPSEGLPIVSYKNAKVFTPPPIRHDEDSESANPGSQQAEEAANGESAGPSNQPIEADPAVQEIVSNLPKVWRVLSELLSHHTAESPPGETRNCYKRVDTPEGPRTVISVSDTFIRLKELIIEKKGLVREVGRLRHLNSHLEIRLDDQEKRLSTVQCELHKTWGVVGRMRAQHQQLHNQEKILRYELQEKRIMVNELKSELDDCRDLWERARRKNNESETECFKLRSEFAARRAKTLEQESGSGESGFSDEDHCDADRSSTPSPTPLLRRRDSLKKVKSLDCEVGESSRGSMAASLLSAASSLKPPEVKTVDHKVGQQSAIQATEASSPTDVPDRAVHVDGENGQQNTSQVVQAEMSEEQESEPEVADMETTEQLAEINLAEICATIDSTINEIRSEIVNSSIALARELTGDQNLPIATDTSELSTEPVTAQGSSDTETADNSHEALNPEATANLDESNQQTTADSQLISIQITDDLEDNDETSSENSQELFLCPRETGHVFEEVSPVQELMSEQFDEGLRSESQLIDDLCGDIEELSLENLEEIAAACGLTTEDISEENRNRAGTRSGDEMSETPQSTEKEVKTENIFEQALLGPCVALPEMIQDQEPASSDQEHLGACGFDPEQPGTRELSGTAKQPLAFTPTPTLDSILSNDDVYCEPPEPSTSEDQSQWDQVSDEERLKAREARALRLQRLEEQCLLLVRKVDITSHRSKFFANRLEELHEHYSTSPSMTTEVLGAAESSSSTVVVSQTQELREDTGGVNREIHPKTSESHLSNQASRTIPDHSSNSNNTQVEASLRLLQDPEALEPVGSQPSAISVETTDVTNRLPFLVPDPPTGGKTDSSTTKVPLVQNENTDPGSTISENLVESTSRPEQEPAHHEEPDILSLPLATHSQTLGGSSTTDFPSLFSSVCQEYTPEPAATSSQELDTCNRLEPILPSPNQILPEEPTPSTSQSQVRDISLATFDERMARREERLKRLEEAASSLHGKVSNTVSRGNVMADRLQEIHEAEVKRKQDERLKERAAEMKYLPLKPVTEEGEEEDEDEED